jgi:hypothetical protein
MFKAARVSALILLLTCSAQAGIIQNETPAPPPSQPLSAVDEPTDASGELTTNTYMETWAPGDLTLVALDVLAALPSLL